MKIRVLAFLLITVVALSSCSKNTASKIPTIALTHFGHLQTNFPNYTFTGSFIIRVNRDTAGLEFSLTDGDGNLGHRPDNGRDIFIKDFRFDTGFVGYFFPEDFSGIEDAKKGLEGSCLFMFTPYIISPRNDSLHIANGDTTHFELYIKDRAGNESNHIITPDIIMIP